MTQATAPNIKPRLCFTVGVTGHRDHKLEGADITALTATVTRTLGQLQQALRAVGKHHHAAFRNEPVQLRMVSALADGADTIVAKAALAAGWRVDACLPFPREQYANDFANAVHHDDFLALLEKVTSTFELPGNHNEATAAYEAVGRLVLEQSDVLLALWDGDSNRGRGGTSRVVADAVARHIPVIHIHTHVNQAIQDTHVDVPVQLLWTGLSDAEIEQPSVEIVPRAPADTTIAQVVAALTVPPENKVDTRMLMQFYRERAATNTPALPYPLLLALTGVHALSRRDFKPMQAEASTAALVVQLSNGRGDHKFSEKLAGRYGVADAAASYFAQIFRSGFVANFTLAGVAVVLALSGLLAPSFKLPIISAELVCVILILINTHAGFRFGWHERWMDNRHLAEQLRSLALTSVIGDLGLRSHAGARDAAAIPGWVGWLARATARETGLPDVNADATYLSSVRDTAMQLVNEQIAYQRINAARMQKLEYRLQRAGEILFGATIVACIGWITAKIAGMPMGLVGTVGVTEIVTFLTASLPALGASIYGIRMQGDFAGVAFRSQVTVTRLERLKRAMQDDPVDYGRLAARLRNLSDIMLNDVSNWRTTYQARPLALPG